MIINETSKELYEASNHINVVKDAVIENKYFQLLFTCQIEGAEKNQIDLLNLQDASPSTKAIPVSYIDDNGVEIIPYYPNDVENNVFYLIEKENKNLYFEKEN